MAPGHRARRPEVYSSRAGADRLALVRRLQETRPMWSRPTIMQRGGVRRARAERSEALAPSRTGSRTSPARRQVRGTSSPGVRSQQAAQVGRHQPRSAEKLLAPVWVTRGGRAFQAGVAPCRSASARSTISCRSCCNSASAATTLERPREGAQPAVSRFPGIDRYLSDWCFRLSDPRHPCPWAITPAHAPGCWRRWRLGSCGSDRNPDAAEHPRNSASVRWRPPGWERAC